MFAEAAVGCSSGTYFLCGRSLERFKYLGKPTLKASASAIKDGWAWPLLSPTGQSNRRCCAADAAQQPALRFLGARGYQLWATGPGQDLGPCCVFSSTVGRAENILEASLAHSISDALSSVSLLSLCSRLALFQSRFPSSSPLFARPLFLFPPLSQAVTRTSIVFLSGSLKPFHPGIICP